MKRMIKMIAGAVQKSEKVHETGIHAVDLFCGAGGLTHGLAKSGINVKLGIDTDSHCEYPYTANNDAEFMLESVEKVHAEDIIPYFRDAKYTLLAGCAPCQTFSVYNKKATDADSRWWLLKEFFRLVEKLSPDFVTMENVPPLMKQDVFIEFVENLKDEGYQVHYEIVDCADYGVPQKRRRLVLLASKHGGISLMSPKKYKNSPKTVRDVIGKLHSIKSGEQDPRDPIHFCRDLSQKNIERLKFSKPGGTWEDWPDHLIAECHKKETGKTFKRVYSRMEWDKPAPTMTTLFTGFGNGRFGHPEQDRALSLREGAILQSFPGDYEFSDFGKPLNKAALARMIGNAGGVGVVGSNPAAPTTEKAQKSNSYRRF